MTVLRKIRRAKLAATHGPDHSRSRDTICNENYPSKFLRLQVKVCQLSQFLLLRGKHRTHAYQFERSAACSNASSHIYTSKWCTKHAALQLGPDQACLGFVSDRTGGVACASRAAPALAGARSLSPQRPFLCTLVPAYQSSSFSLPTPTRDHPLRHSHQSSGVYQRGRCVIYAAPRQAGHICKHRNSCRECSTSWTHTLHLHECFSSLLHVLLTRLA